jgi:hypothetical protein
MTKTIVVCMLAVGMMLLASVGFMANSSVGGPARETDLIKPVATADGPVLLASFSCGSGECDDGWSCCYDYDACCPPGMNLYCPGSGMCYSSISDAEADCGNNYYPCASPVE